MPWTRPTMAALLWVTAAVAPAGESALTPATHERLLEVRSLMERDLHHKAADQLRVLVARTGNRPYDLAIVQQHLGHAYVALQDYTAACRAIEAALQTQALPDGVAHNQSYFLAQLYLQAEDHTRALSVMEKWLQTEASPEPQAHTVAAQIYYAAGRNSKALEQIGQALEKSERPPESWYRFLIALYLEEAQYTQAEPVIRRAVTDYPASADLWRSLANVHMAMGSEHEALAVLMLAYRQNMLNASEHERLIQFIAHLGVPEKAGRLLGQWRRDGILEDSVDRARLEARLWAMARERRRAIQVLAGLANQDSDGDAYLLLGQLLFEEENWPKATEALQTALKTNGLNSGDSDRARLLLGTAAYRAGSQQLATRVFEQLRHHPELGETADHWLSVVKATDGRVPADE